MQTNQTPWRVRIVVRLINGNDSFIDCLTQNEANEEVLRLRMSENKSIKFWRFENLTFEQWKSERDL